jgi:hypothetical protein
MITQKTVEIAEELGIAPYGVLGLLSLLFERELAGQLPTNAQELAAVTYWDGSPDHLWQVLRSRGFFDRDIASKN